MLILRLRAITSNATSSIMYPMIFLIKWSLLCRCFVGETLTIDVLWHDSHRYLSRSIFGFTVLDHDTICPTFWTKHFLWHLYDITGFVINFTNNMRHELLALLRCFEVLYQHDAPNVSFFCIEKDMSFSNNGFVQLKNSLINGTDK